MTRDSGRGQDVVARDRQKLKLADRLQNLEKAVATSSQELEADVNIAATLIRKGLSKAPGRCWQGQSRANTKLIRHSREMEAVENALDEVVQAVRAEPLQSAGGA
ncbi:MAG: hypothetical protein M5U25_16290 [Planctomycetota bacterium]|nr:hypothetical protein [Planctomycetota bacterium]